MERSDSRWRDTRLVEGAHWLTIGKRLFGLALICLMIITAEAVSLLDQHIRERLIAGNARWPT